MGEGLGEVAPGLPGTRVGLLGEEPEVVGAGGGPLEELDGLLRPTGAGQALDEPVGAEEEAVLVPGPAVDKPVRG